MLLPFTRPCFGASVTLDYEGNAVNMWKSVPPQLLPNTQTLSQDGAAGRLPVSSLERRASTDLPMNTHTLQPPQECVFTLCVPAQLINTADLSTASSHCHSVLICDTGDSVLRSTLQEMTKYHLIKMERAYTMEYGTPTVHVYYVMYCNFHIQSHQEFVELCFLIILANFLFLNQVIKPIYLVINT